MQVGSFVWNISIAIKTAKTRTKLILDTSGFFRFCHITVIYLSSHEKVSSVNVFLPASIFSPFYNSCYPTPLISQISSTVQGWNFEQWYHYTGLDKFISTRPIFRARKHEVRKKTDAQDQSVRPILHPMTCSFHV